LADADDSTEGSAARLQLCPDWHRPQRLRQSSSASGDRPYAWL